jgi:WD40 repeat protein
VWDAKTRTGLATYEFTKGGDPWTWQRKQDDGKEEDNKEERKPIKDSWEFVTSSWEETGRLVAVGTETSAVAIFAFQRNPVKLNLLTCWKIPPKSEKAEEEAVSVVAFNKDASMLAVAHMDSNVYIYNVTYDAKVLKVEPFKKPVSNRAAPSHLQWSDDSTMVQVLTRDYEIARFFVDKDQKTISRCVKLPDPDKFKWYGDPLLTGWETKGCLQREMDGTDINDVTVTSDKKLVACGDDYGHVRLHNYPVVVQEPNKCYSGHAEHVVGVEFMGNDNYLISCGGADFAIFQWVVKKGK